MRAAAAATLRHVPRVALAIPPRLRRRLLIALVLALTLLSVYRFWFRDSSFVGVQHVTVSGLTTPDAPRIRTALVAAAHGMTTLDVRQGALDGAVAGFPVVKTVVAEPQFPHGMRIRVIEERPLAVLEVGGRRLPLAADGSVLRGVVAGHPLALIRSQGSVSGDRLTGRAPLAALHVLRAGPAALASRISAAGDDQKRGLTLSLRNGPDVIFGDGAGVAAKWAAAAAVLADASSLGASYVDVRLPERPVAGGLATQTLAPISSTGGDASATTNTPAPQTAAPATATPNSQLPPPNSQPSPQP
jgi:cell division protein FtsQ